MLTSIKHHQVLAVIASLLMAVLVVFVPTVNAEPAPDAPTNLQAAPGDGQVTLTWTAPYSDPAEPIDHYVVYQDGVDVAHPASTSQTITSLTNGQTYQFTVAANNNSGLGAQSGPVPATPVAAATVPSVITDLAASPGDGRVTLTWTVPNNGGAAIDHYVVKQNGVDTGLNPTGTPFTITGLTNGVEYTFTVAAHNSVGAGPDSNEAKATPAAAATAPGAPTITSATPGNAQITLAWSPGSNGGSAITGYKVYRGTTSGSETLLTTLGNVLTYTDSGLTNGQTYYYKVSASNSVGEGALSNEASATPTAPASKPTAPQSLQAVAGDKQVILSWTAPASDGGASIDRYAVYQDNVQVNTPTATTVTITGLTNGQEYNFTVAAHNSAGWGPNTTALPVTPSAGSTVPSVPTNVQATPGDAEVIVSWTAPTSNGGAAIDYYLVFQDGVEVARPTGMSATITGLTNGQEYNITVAAHNSVGDGPKSAAVLVTPSASIVTPSAPTGLEATPGDGEAYLSWTAPGNNGGATIDYYVVYRDGVDILHVNETSATISGLANARAYTFTVAAHNSAGEGPRSPSVTVTPSASTSAPSAPTNVRVTAGDGQVTITWSAPSNPGSSPIDYYIVYMNGVDVAHPTTTSATIGGLTNGVEYRFIIVAHNAVGKGAMTTSYKATPSNPSFLSDPTNILLLIIAAALFVVIALGVMLLMRKNAVLPPRAPTDPRGDLAASNAPKATAPLSGGMTMAFDPPVEDSRANESILCPRCGKPNSGSTCTFCGKALKRPK